MIMETSEALLAMSSKKMIAARVNLGWSVERLAKESGAPVSSVYLIERLGSAGDEDDQRIRVALTGAGIEARRGEAATFTKTSLAPALPAEALLAAGLFVQVAESANDVIILTTPFLDPPHPLIVYVNPAFVRLTGYSAAEIIGCSPRILQGMGTDRIKLDKIRNALATRQDVHEKVLNFGKGGERYWIDLRIVPLRGLDGDVTHFAAIQRDITMDKGRLYELELVAERDALTGIPNRPALLRVIEKQIVASRVSSNVTSAGSQACLAYINVDNHAAIDTAHGHGSLDAVLLGLADRLTENMRRADVLGRVGEERFAICMPGVTFRDAEKLVDRLQRVVAAEPFDTLDGPVYITVSVGLTSFCRNDDLFELLRRAERTVSVAKQAVSN